MGREVTETRQEEISGMELFTEVRRFQTSPVESQHRWTWLHRLEMLPDPSVEGAQVLDFQGGQDLLGDKVWREVIG